MAAALVARRFMKVASAQITTFRSLSSKSQDLVAADRIGNQLSARSLIHQTCDPSMIKILDVQRIEGALETVRKADDLVADLLNLEMEEFSKLLDVIQNYPEAKFQVYNMRRLAKRITSGGNTNRGERTETAVAVPSKSREGHFDKDLGMAGVTRSIISGKEFDIDDMLDTWEHILRVRKTLKMRIDHEKNDVMTRDEVTSRVIDVIECYPGADHSMVMKEGCFDKDVLSVDDRKVLLLELRREFKLKKGIPYGILTSKLVIDYIYEIVRSQSYMGEPTVDQINSVTSLVIKVIDDYIKNRCNSGDTVFDITHKAVTLSSNVSYYYPSLAARLRVISAVVDHIQNYPHAKNSSVYEVRIFIKSMSNDDSKDDISWDQIVSRVVDVVKNHPSVVDPSKVKEDSNFEKDLGVSDVLDRDSLRKALALEFKLEMWYDILSCKRAVDYIYDNRRKRMSCEELDWFYDGGLFDREP